jgi:phage-related protein
MRTLSNALLIEKNKLATSYPWVPLIHFSFTAPIGHIYLAANTENVTYQAQVYTAFDIQVELPADATEEKIPECKIIVANQSRAFESMIVDTLGGVDTPVTITLVNTNNLADDYSDLTWGFTILQSTCNSKEVQLDCSLYSPLDKRFPPDRYFGTTCRYKYFKGVECKYAGAVSVCNRSFDSCKALSNLTNFGGFLGIDDKEIAFLFTKII